MEKVENKEVKKEVKKSEFYFCNKCESLIYLSKDKELKCTVENCGGTDLKEVKNFQLKAQDEITKDWLFWNVYFSLDKASKDEINDIRSQLNIFFEKHNKLDDYGIFLLQRIAKLDNLAYRNNKKVRLSITKRD